MRIRGESHLLLIGEPGTGKSQFLKWATLMSPRSVLTTGIGSTSAGLTVSAVKETGGEWILEAGALVLADCGVCAIDEFSSIKERDRATIHEAMEQQTLSVAKAGLVCKLQTRTTVIAATNPKGRYDRQQSISVNTTLASPLLSRFDIILIMLDDQNKSWDENVSDHILKEQLLNGAHVEELWNIQLLRSYIAYIKTINPELTTESKDILTAYYKQQRRADIQGTARTTIRMLESLIRISQAHARLMMRNKVTVQDAVMAVIITESSISTTALLGTTSALHSFFPENPEVEYKQQEAIVLSRLGLDGYFRNQDPPTPLFSQLPRASSVGRIDEDQLQVSQTKVEDEDDEGIEEDQLQLIEKARMVKRKLDELRNSQNQQMAASQGSQSASQKQSATSKQQKIDNIRKKFSTVGYQTDEEEEDFPSSGRNDFEEEMERYHQQQASEIDQFKKAGGLNDSDTKDTSRTDDDPDIDAEEIMLMKKNTAASSTKPPSQQKTISQPKPSVLLAKPKPRTFIPDASETTTNDKPKATPSPPKQQVPLVDDDDDDNMPLSMMQQSKSRPLPKPLSQPPKAQDQPYSSFQSPNASSSQQKTSAVVSSSPMNSVDSLELDDEPLVTPIRPLPQSAWTLPTSPVDTTVYAAQTPDVENDMDVNQLELDDEASAPKSVPQPPQQPTTTVATTPSSDVPAWRPVAAVPQEQKKKKKKFLDD